MDIYNPLYNEFKAGKFKNIDLVLNEQNQIYGAQHWYPLLRDVTPQGYLFELEEADINALASGETIPSNLYFAKFIEFLIATGYQFVKTTHKSAHAFKPILNFQDFAEQITNPQIIMSFRRYHCKYLFFRKWTAMNLECRVYVHELQVKYVELYRDALKEFKPSLFPSIIQFVTTQVIPKLDQIYDTFTADVFLCANQGWQVVEINSPLWLKCGTYLVNYDWEKDRIHGTTALQSICRYKDEETGDVMEHLL